MAFLHELMKDYKNEIKGEWLTLWCLEHGCYSRLLSLAASQPGSISVMDVIADFAMDVMADFAMDVMADFAFSCRQPAMVCLCDGCYGLCLLQTGSQGLSLCWMLWQSLSLADRQPGFISVLDVMAEFVSCRQPGFISVLDVMAEFVSCRQAARVYLCVGCYGRVCLLQTGSQGLSL